MIIRILSTIIIAALLWIGLRLLWRIYSLIMNIRAVASGQYRPRQPDQNVGHSTMVKCSQCQLYILDKDAIVYDGRPYCSEDHARSAKAR